MPCQGSRWMVPWRMPARPWRAVQRTCPFTSSRLKRERPFISESPRDCPIMIRLRKWARRWLQSLRKPGLSTTKFRATPSRDTVAVTISTTGHLATTSGWEPARTARLRPKAAFFAPNGELIRSYTWTMRPTAVSPLNSVLCLPSRFPLSSCSTFCVSMTACL